MFTEERMERRSIALVLILGLALVLGSVGCQQAGPKSGDDDGSAGGGRDFATDTGEVEIVESVGLVDLETIYFDYDKAAIRSDQRANLQSDAAAIKQRDNLGVVTLEGNCDERGSEEYNLALGERRAAAVKQYLVDLGVPASRLRTVSFGESKPSAFGHDESAWKWNRRVEFAVNR
jgi:peptidoglycan-associated lipoprotein